MTKTKLSLANVVGLLEHSRPPPSVKSSYVSILLQIIQIVLFQRDTMLDMHRDAMSGSVIRRNVGPNVGPKLCRTNHVLE